MSAADLVSNLQGSIATLSGALGLNTSDTKPAYATSLDGATIPRSFQREHWLKVQDVPSNYGFGVEAVAAGNTLSINRFVTQIVGGIFNNNEFEDIWLPITPQEINQTEDFAVAIRPTQGGTVVNHSGNKYKTLQISGTTGVHPYRGVLGVNPATGVANGQTDDLKFRSGYEVFQHFRAWIKGYHESKKFPLKQNLRMIFRNYKDWEFLYVEPLKFSMKRSASKPLMYEYTIQFKVLSHVPNPQSIASFLGGVIGGVTSRASEACNNFKKLSTKSIFTGIGSINQLSESYRQVQLAIKNNAKQPFDLSDMSVRSISEFVTARESQDVLKAIGDKISQARFQPSAHALSGGDSSELPGLAVSAQIATATNRKKPLTQINPKKLLEKLISNLGEIKNKVGIDVLPEAAQRALSKEADKASTLSRKEIRDLRDRTERAIVELADSVGLSNDQYATTFGFVSTVDQTSLGIVPDEVFDALYGLSEGVRALDIILSNDEFFDTGAKISSRADSANGAAGTITKAFRFPDPNAKIRAGVVPFGATLERIAEAELGDAGRWTELAELNALKSPYIVDDTGSGFKVTYTVVSAGFNNPIDLPAVLIGNVYRVSSDPLPAGAWIGKGDFLAEYQGGNVSLATSWKFSFPEAGAVVYVVDRDEYLQYTGITWDDFNLSSLQQDGVLRPGDTILLPTNQAGTNSSTTLGPRDNVFTNGLSQSEKALAADLRLTSQNDLDLLPSGDFGISAGTVNGAQAIVLKLLYEKGSYPGFPEIGTSLKIGGKTPSVAKIRAEVLSSLLQDPRIKDVSQINLLQKGNRLELSFTVYFKDIQNPIPVTIPVG